MAVGIAVCLLLGGLFLYLSARQYRRSARGAGGAAPPPLPTTVTQTRF